MKITEHIYQVSGNSFGTNSSNYILDAGDQLILFDAGYSEPQMQIMERTLQYWGLGEKKITHTFLTHCHLDHAANASRLQKRGSRILIGERDADILSHGGPEVLEKLFGTVFTPCEPDQRLKNGDLFQFGEFTVQCIALPGHTAGSMAFLVQDGEKRCMVTGDFVALNAVMPDETDQEVLLSAMIKPGFLEDAYGESLKKVLNLDVDILLTGHLLPYIGKPRKLFEKAYEIYRSQPHQIMDTEEL